MIGRESIRIDEVSMTYGSSKILDSVSLSIGKGSVVTMVGPNGCGKTTLLKIINNLLKPDKGRVLVEGMEVNSMPSHRLARIMGYVPQGHRISFPFKVRDVVITGRMPYISAFSSPKREDLERTEQALSLVGISGLADQPYTQISGGERQLVMIARAMVQQPSVLLLDEPTSYLDFKNQISTLKMIKEISRNRGVTVVMTLHDPNHALMFSDEIVLLRKLNGSREENVIAFGSPNETMTPQNIQAAYGMEVEILDVRGRKLLLPV
ncbi:MAG: Cobalamin import ATP-binding protein BtuD [Methanosaeta sp. PtaU1.Bin112]|nr:MAG: Cobalamin import ATP-binding protein BtuD [Methanosaeta sp. PtaU1.Bin112]